MSVYHRTVIQCDGLGGQGLNMLDSDCPVACSLDIPRDAEIVTAIRAAGWHRIGKKSGNVVHLCPGCYVMWQQRRRERKPQ